MQYAIEAKMSCYTLDSIGGFKSHGTSQFFILHSDRANNLKNKVTLVTVVSLLSHVTFKYRLCTCTVKLVSCDTLGEFLRHLQSYHDKIIIDQTPWHSQLLQVTMHLYALKNALNNN